MTLEVADVLERVRREELDEVGVGCCKHVTSITESALDGGREEGGRRRREEERTEGGGRREEGGGRDRGRREGGRSEGGGGRREERGRETVVLKLNKT